MILSLRTRYDNYIFNWGETGDSEHPLHLSYIPVLYIPRILNCVQTRTTPARGRQQQQQSRGEERAADLEWKPLCRIASVVQRLQGEKTKREESPEGLDRWKKCAHL